MRKGGGGFHLRPFQRVCPQMRNERQSLKKEDRSCTPSEFSIIHQAVVPVLVVTTLQSLMLFTQGHSSYDPTNAATQRRGQDSLESCPLAYSYMLIACA